jgi:hypothetical protein
MLGGLTAALATACAEQPDVQCFAALSVYSPYTVRLDKVSGDCPEEPTAMFVGAQTYVKNPTNPGDGINSIALQAQEAGEWIARGQVAEPQVLPPANQKPYGFGKFTSKHPDSKDICEVPSLTPGEVTLAAVPETIVTPDGDDEGTEPDEVLDPQDAVSASYKWSNVQVYVTAANTGTQWAGDLEYTKNGCTAKYRALAVSAAVYCGTEEETPKPNQAACDEAQSNSTVSDDFAPLKCDPNLLHCVLTGDFPALK